MTVKLKMICSVCGSTDVGRDAFAEWDYDAQQWVLRGDPYDDGVCFNEECASQGNSSNTLIETIEEDVPEPPTEATRYIHQREVPTPTDVKFGL